MHDFQDNVRAMLAATLFVFLLLPGLPTMMAETHDGHALYQQQCAKCHGPHGEGVAGKADEPLYGELSIDELADVIHDTMPEDDPARCKGVAATAVAEYVHAEFYSPAARARDAPPRIELSHLTATQYENSVADLAGAFLGRAEIGKPRGLFGEYFTPTNLGFSFGLRDKTFERLDPQIDFDFADSEPQPMSQRAGDFGIRWTGSLLVDETGVYEFAVRTRNGIRLWINDPDRPLIDAWVVSGREVVKHATAMRLLGGRAYPVKLDFFTFREPAASVQLLWKAPHGVWEVIPREHLSTKRVPPTFVVTTPFPPDDASAGYERGIGVSKAWEDATTYAAIEVATYVANHVDQLADCERGDPQRERKLQESCQRFVQVAFRRPLTAEQVEFFVDQHFAPDVHVETAAKRVVLLALKSPRFLYPALADTPQDQYATATHLALALWDSLPDERLLTAAENGTLTTAEGVRGEATRMLWEAGTRNKLKEFFRRWLSFEKGDDLAKDTSAFPAFDAALTADLRKSLELFLDDIVWGDDPDYRRLLLSNEMYANHRLADYYGLATTENDGFFKVDCDTNERAGIVTHPFLLAALSYHRSTSPIHRGVFLTRQVLGRTLRPPPMAIEFMEGQFPARMTMREKVARLTEPESCQVCHRVINPLGFSLENYDAVGRFRREQEGTPVDAEADYPMATGEEIRLTGARSLAAYAAADHDAQRGFIRHLFHHTAKQPVAAYGADTLERLHTSFVVSGFNIRALLVDIATISAREQNSYAETRKEDVAHEP